MFVNSLQAYAFFQKIIFCSLACIFLIRNSSAQVLKTISPCKCSFSNGSMIDLSSLGNRKEARWKNMPPTHKENYTYYYNPCYSFKLGSKDSGCAVGVAVCQKTMGQDVFYDCGRQNKASFRWNVEHNHINLLYVGDPRMTNVTLKCSETAYEPELIVYGENITNIFEMTLISRCACPDLCRDDHLSAGSVLVIIFLTFLSLYLILGIVHSSLTRGAHGWELLPHYEFWSDFPLLVRDGFVFVISGCKPETAYERI